MGKMCSCPRNSDANSSQALLSSSQTGPGLQKQGSVLIYDPNAKQKPFRRWIELSFYAFAGSSRHAKKQGLYMSQNELQLFLDSVNIISPSVTEIFNAMDSDIVDGRISVNEFIDYFCNVEFNPNCIFLQEAIESNENWLYLQKALRMFDIIDIEHKGYLIYSEFVTFGHLIGLTNEETTEMWQNLDQNDSGSITIDAMFSWYRSRFLKKTNINERITNNNNNNDGNNYSTFINNSTNSSSSGGDGGGNDTSNINASIAGGNGATAPYDTNSDIMNDKNGMYYSQGRKLGDYMKEHLSKDNSNSLEYDNTSVTRDYDSANSQE